jgi:predicted nucleotidyltransferase
MSRHREAFEDFAERAQEELGESLEKLVLYGSVARGEERENSDVDILIVLDEDSRKLKEKALDLAYELTLKHEIHVSPILLSKEEFEKVEDFGSKFLESVMDEGEFIRG